MRVPVDDVDTAVGANGEHVAVHNVLSPSCEPLSVGGQLDHRRQLCIDIAVGAQQDEHVPAVIAHQIRHLAAV